MPQQLPDTVKRIMADIFDVDIGAIGDNAAMDVLEEWDSGHHINLVFALEEEFGVAFEVSEIERITRFSEIVSVLQSKL